MELTDTEWIQLTYIARRNGKSNIRRFVRAEMYRFYQRYKDLPAYQAAAPTPKRKDNFLIPDDLVAFYASLSAYYNTPVSSIIFRFVILPHFIQQAPIYYSLFKCAGTSATDVPVFEKDTTVRYTLKGSQPGSAS